MANRFRWLALGLMPALFAAGGALAQQAPIDLAPAAAAEKPAKPAKTAAAAPLPAAEAESERLGELSSAVVSLDKPLHEGPGLLDGIGFYHGTVRPR